MLEEMEEQAKTLMAKLDRFKSTEGSSGWLFGLSNPTAIDAHLVVFIARMQDAGRLELIPEYFREYAERAKATPEWKEVMRGYQTMFKP